MLLRAFSKNKCSVFSLQERRYMLAQKRLLALKTSNTTQERGTMKIFEIIKKSKIKQVLLFIVFFNLLMLLSIQTLAQTTGSSMRGLRVDPSYFYNLYPGQSITQVSSQVVAQAKASGVNTLFVYAYNSVYGSFYPTTYTGTVVESRYGKLNLVKALTNAAKLSGLKVVAVVPVNSFKTLWDKYPAWRAKKQNGTDYKPFSDTYLLSAWHPDFRTWLKGFYTDLLTKNPDIDGIEAVEPTVDYQWRKESDYNAVATQKFKTLYPTAVLGDQSWLNFRAQGMTDLINILTTAAGTANKKSYLVQTWPAKSNGNLFSSTVIKDNLGLDLDAILKFTGNAKLTYLMGEFMWQQWAAEYGPAKFPVSWTRQAALAFINYVGNKSIPLLHVEISPFAGSFTNVSPTREEFRDTLLAIKNLNVGIDVYDFNQIAKMSAWNELMAWTTSVTPTPTPTPTPVPTPTPTPVPTGAVYGITLDSVSNIAEIVKSLSSLSHKPTTRIVFDEGMPASYYANAAAQIHAVSFVMGEILDSFYMKSITTSGYEARTTEYMNTLSNNVDIWEIGNEINGEWLGDTPSVVAKMNASYNKVKSAGKKTALTLYYNEECWANRSNEMFTWAQANVSAAMKSGLDYVWISYYEDDCNNLQPNWPSVFQKLAAMFPNSKIGFGEVGTNKSASKAAYINRYYNMTINQPNYVGGYFWWYGSQDLVPMTKPLWSIFNAAIQ